MNSSLISQIVLVIIAVVLIVMYVLPGFEQIGAIQDEQAKLQNAIATAEEFSSQLAQLQSQAASLPVADIEALNTYLPEEVDQITTMWVLDTIAAQAGVTVSKISIAGADKEGDEAGTSGFDTVAGEQVVPGEMLTGVSFTVEVAGSYNAFKEFLRLMETNEFPLLPQKLSIGAAVGSENGAAAGEGSGEGGYTLELLVPQYQPKETNRANEAGAMEADGFMLDEEF